VCSAGDGYEQKMLDIESTDLGVVKALEIRFSRKVIEKLNTYDVQQNLSNIYTKMFSGQVAAAGQTAQHRVDSLAY
jgi:hypothetical protein